MTLKLIIVDDSRFQLHQLENALKDLDCEVKACLKAEDVLDELEKNKYDCVFSDLLMPEMDGFELTNKIRKKHPEQVIAVLTANIQKTAKEKCLELGINYFINKPFETEDLSSIIQELKQGGQGNDSVAS